MLQEQLKKIKTKHDNHRKLGVAEGRARKYANTRKSYWGIINSPTLNETLTNTYFEKIGYTSIYIRYKLVH